MANIVRIHVDGPRDRVLMALKQVREAASPGERARAVVWCPARWQEESEITIDDYFEIEVPLALNRAEAVDRARRAIDKVDPQREVIKGGDFELTPLDL